MQCSKCAATMIIRESKTGKFYACPNSYPGNNHGTITHSQSLEQHRKFREYWIGFTTTDDELIDELREY